MGQTDGVPAAGPDGSCILRVDGRLPINIESLHIGLAESAIVDAEVVVDVVAIGIVGPL